jgi:molybdopterin-containing oxidoreductase family iron-sulfur binding subunit
METEGRGYWRSLAELANTPEFREELGPEFAVGADLPPDSTSRRKFLQVMAASVSLAGLTGCRWPKENIFPYASRPEGRMEGVPVKYATSMDLGGVSKGLLATSFDGRPIKIDGNDLHPENRGANDILAEASVLELYDPDRAQAPWFQDAQGEYIRTWDEFTSFAQGHFIEFRRNGGAGLAILAEASSSPSVERMKAKLLAACPQAKWHEYEAISRDNERVGTTLVFGVPTRPHYSLADAKVIVAFDGDLFSGHPAALGQIRDFVKGRSLEGGQMNRLYAIESAYSLTGAMADHRFPTPSSMVLLVLSRLTVELLKQGLQSQYLSTQLSAALEKYSQNGYATPYVQALAKDLLVNRGTCVLTAGYRQPAEVHGLVHTLNAALENAGKTVHYSAEPEPSRLSHLAAIQALNKDLSDGKVETLVILGGNPVYNAPADLAFGENLKKAKTSFHLALHRDETSRLCTWTVPRAHYLEAWGDGRAYDGTLCAAQPLIHPLYEGKSVIEFLSLMAEDAPRPGYAIVREVVMPLLPGPDREVSWREFLNNGVQTGTQTPVTTATPKPDMLAKRMSESAPAVPSLGKDHLEIVFCPSPNVYDGRFANSGWLQELPDFMTKTTWDNAALLSPHTAERLGVEHGNLVRLKLGGKELTIVAYLMPGQAADSVAVCLGYGRTASGRVGNGVGFNTYALRTTGAMDFSAGLALEPTTEKHILACTQDHHLIDKVGAAGRDLRVTELIREAPLSEYQEHQDFAHHVAHHPPMIQLWNSPVEYDGYKWGMAIDLQKCVGCNACVTACQAENNIPVVGKEQVSRQREMHWLRVDRYFKGDVESPGVAHQPVACVHCESAPCEEVCPVGATMHDHDGVNVMVYNRCIGTRYCSNNCPFKVRRFNFFHYHLHHTASEKMVFNPDVTLRSRGVMEKCNYCMQRISHGKIAAKNERRSLQDGEIRTACQVSCPAEAITFGDLNNLQSKVAQLQQDPRSYLMLEELNVRPRTAHLARVRNPNPELVEKA